MSAKSKSQLSVKTLTLVTRTLTLITVTRLDEKLEKPCKVCGKDYKTVKQLNDHNLQEHGGTLKCSFCEKMITNDQAAEEEQRIQVMVKKMLNNLCQPTLNITL